ncbi:MAG: UDP-2,3-diacylglucosamine diphosphatase [Pseudomonadota bacterium]
MPIRETLFISDLHLDASREHLIRLCLDLFEGRAEQADALYILGDLFEAWIGDDDDNPAYTEVKAGLHQLTQSGVPVFVMQGNRDFLLGDDFCRETGCQLLADPCVVELYGKPTLLMHGDTLCTKDTGYLQLRQILHNPAWQQDFLSKPLADRRAMAEHLRAESQKQTSQKDMAIMDVTPEAVADVMREHQVTHLIHGHTHRPAIHDFKLDEQDVRRTVLGDWYEKGSLLELTQDSCQLHTFG